VTSYAGAAIGDARAIEISLVDSRIHLRVAFRSRVNCARYAGLLAIDLVHDDFSSRRFAAQPKLSQLRCDGARYPL
jgi:hypothetical protein